MPDGFKFGNTLEILQWSEKKHGVFEFQDNEAEIFYGKLNQTKENIFNIDLVNSDGSIEKKLRLRFFNR